MASFVGNNPGFFYIRYLLIFMYGLYALFVQSNNPNILVNTLGFLWLGLSGLTFLLLLNRIRNKGPYLKQLVFFILDLGIALLILLKSKTITDYFPIFVGVLAILMALILFFYRSKENKNTLLYLLLLFIIFFGISLFFSSVISDVFVSYLIAIFFAFFGLTGLFLTAGSHIKAMRKKS